MIVAGNRRCAGGEDTIYDCKRYRGELDGCTHAIDQGVHCTVNETPIDIKKNQQISELPSIGKEYDISFELLITNFGTDAFQNVIHFTLGENAAKYGDRNPAVWLTKQKKLQICSAISGNKNYCGPDVLIPTVLETGKWIKIEISQTLVDGKYIYDVKVNGECVINIENTKAEQFGPVKVFVGDNWYPNVNGKIKNLNIFTKTEAGGATTSMKSQLSSINIKKNQQIS